MFSNLEAPSSSDTPDVQFCVLRLDFKDLPIFIIKQNVFFTKIMDINFFCIRICRVSKTIRLASGTKST